LRLPSCGNALSPAGLQFGGLANYEKYLAVILPGQTDMRYSLLTQGQIEAMMSFKNNACEK